MVTLVIDTSTQFLNLALVKKQTIASLSQRVKTNHSDYVMPMIHQLLSQNNLSVNDISKIAVSQGPGSYTGLRIGISIAKMLAYALKIPLYQFSSLELLALQSDAQVVVPLIDARRQAVYTGQYGMHSTYSDEYSSLESLVDRLNQQQCDICFVADHIETLLLHYLDKLTINYQLKNIEYYDLSQVHKLVLTETDAFNMKPSYLRLSEAEANLLVK